MEFERRKGIIEKFSDWEKRYPVSSWRFGGMEIWPVIKIVLFFNEFKIANTNTLVPGPKHDFSLKSHLKLLFYKLVSLIRIQKLEIGKTEFIFSGASSHRVKWKKEEFNRYFDPIMNFVERDSGNFPLLLEYKGRKKKTTYRSERTIEISNLLPAFHKVSVRESEWESLKHDDSFFNFLKELESKTSTKEDDLKFQLLKKVQSIQDWKRLFEFFFRKTGAKFAFGLCYYSNAMLGMNLAGKRLGITTIDMQHGSQGRLHPAYYFDKSIMPDKGFMVLPDFFWTWDNNSKNEIDRWTVNSNHIAITGGNPWVQFLDENPVPDIGEIFKKSKPIILVSLQPLNPILGDYFIELMKKTKNEYSWWLRFHPRMEKRDVEKFKEKLAANDLIESVNLEEASELPLPFILRFSDLHISRYSGAISEAAILGVVSLIIDEIGVNVFSEIIEQNLAIPSVFEDPIKMEVQINEVLNRKIIKNNTYSPDFRLIINQFQAMEVRK